MWIWNKLFETIRQFRCEKVSEIMNKIDPMYEDSVPEVSFQQIRNFLIKMSQI